MIHRTISIALSATVAVLCAVALSGCIAEEAPIAPYDRGSAVQSTIAMGADYRYQVYFDIETASPVKSGLITEWDLGFQCDPSGFGVALNTAKVMSVADLGPVDFIETRSVKGLSWRYDRPSGEWDSTAVGAWWTSEGGRAVSRGHVYVIDRGYGPDGRAIGHAKIMMIDADARKYTVRIADMNNGFDRTIEVPRDTTRSLMGLTFDGGGAVVNIEPPKDTWDILATRYTQIFYAPELTPYAVSGVLLNRYGTQAAADTTRGFEEITSADINDIAPTTRLDAIGYDWKSYDLQQGIYTVDSPTYILRDSRGFYYKFRFLDFYNGSGEKGYPLLESQKL